MNSCIYEGTVRHRRFSPVPHRFAYRLFMLYLDLAELPAVFGGRWLWSVDRSNIASFWRADHIGDPAVALDSAIRCLVAQRTGRWPQGPIRLLTHCRYFGYVFNPVSFYFCYDVTGARVETIVAEITNTPWGERHCYVLVEADNRVLSPRKRFCFDKGFHVSPFMDMHVSYDWRFTEPGSRLAIHMENHRAGHCFFDATMVLRREALTGSSLARVLVHYPFMTAKVIGAIHWQALQLWIKGVPFHPHPKKETSSPAADH